MWILLFLKHQIMCFHCHDLFLLAIYALQYIMGVIFRNVHFKTNLCLKNSSKWYKFKWRAEFQIIIITVIIIKLFKNKFVCPI